MRKLLETIAALVRAADEGYTDNGLRHDGETSRSFQSALTHIDAKVKTALTDLQAKGEVVPVRAPLFVGGEVVLNSGKTTHFKVECDHLSDAEIDVLARIVAERLKASFGAFGSVHAIPRGGLRFGRAMSPYATRDNPRWLIVDDVMTTGGSILRARSALIKDGVPPENIAAAVMFHRGGGSEWLDVHADRTERVKQLHVESAVTVRDHIE